MAYQTPDHESNSDSNTPTRLYNPYKDLEVPIRNLYQLPTSPEYLFVEEARRKRRSWGENLTFYTGCGYLAGAVGGAGVGFVEGVKSFETGDSVKLRVNRILNSSGHAGRSWGNRLGVIGLLYAGIESGIEAARDTDDVWNSVAAGLGTGALYRAVNQEAAANGSPANDATAQSVFITADKVTLLQASVDKMALSMFNALRLLPATLGDETTRDENVAAIKLLAKEVIETAKETDTLIDDLPGLDRTEEEQMEELRRLQIQSEEEAQTLRQVAEEAERWMDRARDSLRVISETRLRR